MKVHRIIGKKSCEDRIGIHQHVIPVLVEEGSVWFSCRGARTRISDTDESGSGGGQATLFMEQLSSITSLDVMAAQ